MSYRVFKYPIERHGPTILRVPQKSAILSVGAQLEGVVLWIMVDPDQPEVLRDIEAYFTGEEIFQPDIPISFIGTVTYSGLVSHIFERGDYK